MHKNANSISDNTTNTQPWYAVRTFNCQEQKVSDFLTYKGYNNFIPMTLSQEKGDEKNFMFVVNNYNDFLLVYYVRKF